DLFNQVDNLLTYRLLDIYTKCYCILLKRRFQAVLNFAFIVYIPFFDEMLKYFGRVVLSEVTMFTALVDIGNDQVEAMRDEVSKLNPRVIREFLLVSFNKFCKAFIDYCRQDIDVVVIDAFPILIDRNAQSSTYFLTSTYFRPSKLLEETNLKHIRIIPAFFEGGMGKDKTYRTGETQQSLLVLHNQLVGVLIGFDISGCIPE